MSRDKPIDDLLSNFFQSEMRRPWPDAPSPVLAQPSAVVARLPSNPPSQSSSQQGRARMTLAASVALMLGTCLYFSNSWQSIQRPAPHPGVNTGPNVWPESTASTPEAFEKNRKAKAVQAQENPQPGYLP